jgi:hypothetical protein
MKTLQVKASEVCLYQTKTTGKTCTKYCLKNKDTIKCSSVLQVRQWSVEPRRNLQLSDNASRLNQYQGRDFWVLTRALKMQAILTSEGARIIVLAEYLRRWKNTLNFRYSTAWFYSSINTSFIYEGTVTDRPIQSNKIHATHQWMINNLKPSGWYIHIHGWYTQIHGWYIHIRDWYINIHG